jgi:hypothetical protein
MINSIGYTPAAHLGFNLLLFGLFLIPLSCCLRKPFKIENLIQDGLLGFIYLRSGFILLLQGWRLDPLLLLCQFVLVLSGIYLLIKDFTKNTSNSLQRGFLLLLIFGLFFLNW